MDLLTDYSILDQFISNSLDSYNKQLFGSYDDKTGYFEKIQNDETQEEEEVSEEDVTKEDIVEDVNEEELLIDDIFSEKPRPDYTFDYTHSENPNQMVGGQKPGKSLSEQLSALESGGDYGATNKNSSATGKYQFLWGTWGDSIKKITGVKSKEEFLKNPSAQEKYYSFYEKNHLLPQVKQIRNKVDTSLSDVQLAKLIHFRGEKGAVDYLTGKVSDKPEAYNMPTSKYIKQTGGIAIAKTNKQKRQGLNNISEDDLLIPLEGINPIRGLDSYDPVFVNDSFGNSEILLGPEDVKFFNGPVYEKRIKR